MLVLRSSVATRLDKNFEPETEKGFENTSLSVFSAIVALSSVG